MIQRRRRNLQSPLHQNLQGLHLTRRATPRRLGHSLARKWTLRLNLRKMRKRRHLKSHSGVASLALATAFVSKSIFNPEENDPPTLLTTAMMTTLPPIASWNRVPRYSNIPPLNQVRMNLMKTSSLVILKIAVKQQKALEKVQNMLDKSDDMLGEEMDQTKTLTKNLQRLQSRFDNLQGHHNTLLSDHEKLFTNFFK